MNDDCWVVDLHDAVAIFSDYSGKLQVDQSYQMTTSEGAAWGGLMGSLIRLTLAIRQDPPQLTRRIIYPWECR